MSALSLTGRERKALWLWFILAGTSAFALTMGVFWWWGVLIVTIPILLFAFAAPTLLMYLTIVFLPYVVARLRLAPGRARGFLLAGVAAAVFVGLVVPVWSNWQVTQELKRQRALSFGEIGVSVPRGTVALLSDSHLGFKDSTPYLACSFQCLELIESELVEAVAVSTAAALARTGEPVMLYRIVDRDRCDPYPTGGNLMLHVTDKGEDFCFAVSRHAKVGVDLALVEQTRRVYGKGSVGLSVVPVTPPFTMELLVSSGDRLVPVARRVQTTHWRMHLPLWISPRNGADQESPTRFGGRPVSIGGDMVVNTTDWLKLNKEVESTPPA